MGLQFQGVDFEKFATSKCITHDKSFGGKLNWTYSNQHNKQIEEVLAAFFSNSFFERDLSVKYSSSGSIFWGESMLRVGVHQPD